MPSPLPFTARLLRISDAFHFRLRRLWSTLVLRLFFGHLGKGTVLFRQNMIRYPHLIRIGSRTIVRYGGRMEIVLHGQDWEPELTIGNNVNIEQNVHIICHDRISIGDNVSITGNCAIVDVLHPVNAIEHGAKIGDSIDPARSFVEIGAGSFLGYGTIVLPNVRIGRNCVIGAGSVVTRDIPDDSIASGAPAKVIRARTISKIRN